MSNERRDQGRLFSNADKRKPSQPDFRGECSIGGRTYDMQAWERDEQLTVSLAPTRGDKNTYPPDAFRGALDPAPKAKGKKDEAQPVWIGVITGDEGSYEVRAFPKQGKSGPYLTLTFEQVETAPAPAAEPELPPPTGSD